MATIFNSIPKEWSDFLRLEENSFSELSKKIDEERRKYTVYPPEEDMFSAFRLTSPFDVKIVIIGQDPYFNPGQANGLAFSVSKGTVLPPSLKNIFKELEREYGYSVPKNNGDLSSWARQGVLLLNAVLTVREGEPNSHKSLGWEMFTDLVISSLKRKDDVVYLLFGRNAQEKRKLINNKRCLIIETSHPSPLSFNKGFYGSDCFRRANSFLKERGYSEVNFKISD